MTQRDPPMLGFAFEKAEEAAEAAAPEAEPAEGGGAEGAGERHFSLEKNMLCIFVTYMYGICVLCNFQNRCTMM